MVEGKARPLFLLQLASGASSYDPSSFHTYGLWHGLSSNRGVEKSLNNLLGSSIISFETKMWLLSIRYFYTAFPPREQYYSHISMIDRASKRVREGHTFLQCALGPLPSGYSLDWMVWLNCTVRTEKGMSPLLMSMLTNKTQNSSPLYRFLESKNTSDIFIDTC